MLPDAVVIRDADVAPMLGLALAFLWLRPTGVRVRELCAQVMLTVEGYLRPRPDPAAENALRAAFTELDRQLVALMDERPPPGARTVRPAAPRERGGCD